MNYQSGATVVNRAKSSGTLEVKMAGTSCVGGKCSYGSGTGYKGLIQFWNDPNNYIAVGAIHDPGVSPTGVTLMIEGAANGKPIGGYRGNNALTGSSHQFKFKWTANGVMVTIDNHEVLGPYPVKANAPSISFLSAGREQGDKPDVTFSGINFSNDSITTSPNVKPAGDLHSTITSTVTQSGSGTGYAAYVNIHDANSNALSVGIQTDTAAPESGGRPYYVYEKVVNGAFTYGYIAPAASNTPTQITLEWYTGNVAVFKVNGKEIAQIPIQFKPRLFFGVEGNARLNGDTINNTYTNVQVTTPYGIIGAWNDRDFDFHGLNATRTNGNTQNGANFTIVGRASGIPAGKDWDSELVAGVAMIAQGP